MSHCAKHPMFSILLPLTPECRNSGAFLLFHKLLAPFQPNQHINPSAYNQPIQNHDGEDQRQIHV